MTDSTNLGGAEDLPIQSDTLGDSNITSPKNSSQNDQEKFNPSTGLTQRKSDSAGKDLELVRAEALALSASRFLQKQREEQDIQRKQQHQHALAAAFQSVAKKKNNSKRPAESILLDQEQRKLIEESTGRSLSEEEVKDALGPGRESLKEVAQRAKEKWKEAFDRVKHHKVEQHENQGESHGLAKIPETEVGKTEVSQQQLHGAGDLEESSKIVVEAQEIRSDKSMTAIGVNESNATGINTVETNAESSHSHGDDTDQKRNPSESETLSNVVWKRRSGFGKFSLHSPWEKRRIVLNGTKLMYFKCNKEINNEIISDENRGAADITIDQKNTVASQNHSNKINDTHITEEAKNEKLKPQENFRNFWENASMQFKSVQENIAQSFAIPKPEVETSSTEARGSIDLAQDSVSIAISSPTVLSHFDPPIMRMSQFAPTPFSLSVLIKNEIKWKFCFGSQQDQMTWFTALMEVVVKESVREFNEGLKGSKIESNNTKYQNVIGIGNDALGNTPVWAQVQEHPCGDKEKLWEFDNNFEVRNLKKSWSKLPMNDLAYEEVDSVKVNDKNKGKVLSILSAHQHVFHIEGFNLYIAFIAMNFSLFYVRLSSTSINGFWFNFLAINFITWLSVVPSSKMNPKKANVSITSTEKQIIKEEACLHPTNPNFKPRAGITTIKLKEPSRDSKYNGESFIGWMPLNSSVVQVRSHGYLTTKKKIPSPSELYEVISVDVIKSSKRIPNFCQKVEIPNISFKETDDQSENWHCPDIFVVSLSVPTGAPKFGRSDDDGEGVTFTIYYKMKDETRQILREITDINCPSSDPIDKDIDQQVTNGVHLFNNWCKNAPDDPKFQARFKFIPNAHNLKETGLPGWISSYCGKPVLIKRSGITGILYSNPDLKVMEFDINIHPFPYLAKQATAYMKENIFKKALISLTFVIEGRKDEELPEVVIGNPVQLCYPDPDIFISDKDFFSGNSPSSSGDKMADTSIENDS